MPLSMSNYNAGSRRNCHGFYISVPHPARLRIVVLRNEEGEGISACTRWRIRACAPGGDVYIFAFVFGVFASVFAGDGVWHSTARRATRC